MREGEVSKKRCLLYLPLGCISFASFLEFPKFNIHIFRTTMRKCILYMIANFTRNDSKSKGFLIQSCPSTFSLHNSIDQN